jgi:hypothetical protein
VRRLGYTLLLAAVVVPLGATAGSASAPRPLIVVKVRYDNSQTFPIEGARGYLRLRKRGRLVAESNRRRLVRRVAPGRYRLRSFQRTCVGTCANLDPPSHACARRFRVKRGQTARISVVVPWHKKRCRMSVVIED